MAATRARLYIQPGSHPWAAVEAALELESLDFDRTVLLPISPVGSVDAGVLRAEWLPATAGA